MIQDQFSKAVINKTLDGKLTQLVVTVFTDLISTSYAVVSVFLQMTAAY